MDHVIEDALSSNSMRRPSTHRVSLLGVGSFFVVGLMLGTALGMLGSEHPWFNRNEPQPHALQTPKITLQDGERLVGMNWKGKKLWYLTVNDKTKECTYSSAQPEDSGLKHIIENCNYAANVEIGLGPHLQMPDMPPLELHGRNRKSSGKSSKDESNDLNTSDKYRINNEESLLPGFSMSKETNPLKEISAGD